MWFPPSAVFGYLRLKWLQSRHCDKPIHRIKNLPTMKKLLNVVSLLLSSLVGCTNRHSEESCLYGRAGAIGDEFVEPGGGAVVGKISGTTGLDEQGIGILFYWQGKIFSFSPQRSNRLWGLSGLEQSSRSVKLTTGLHRVPKLRMCGAIPTRLLTS